MGLVTSTAEGLRTVDSSLMMRVFQAFALLAALSLAISVGGKWLGGSVAMAGHTDDQTMHEIVIGNDVIAAPANMIRFERARADGVARRLDLYMRWPSMDGYSRETRNDFNHVGGSRRIIFVSLEERMMSRDMSDRFAPIYSTLIERPGMPGPGRTTLYRLPAKAGYVDEELAVAAQPGRNPFVARCLTGASAAESLAPCERDVHVGRGLSLSYRFPRELLGQWEKLDAALMKQAGDMLHGNLTRQGS